MIHKARLGLIRLGKVLPFIICFVVMLSYSESIFDLLSNSLIYWCGNVIPNKPFSWFVGSCFEYNLQTLGIMTIISIAIETCIYNKMACAYLGINLAEKSYFDFEMDVWLIYAICLANILVAGYLTFKGIRIARRK